ncbi:MAG: tRNA lysidine(34) synthetase TilS [Bacteriovoracaceae bacterium]|nr:tRNA lysidine(34) synthetase TilS [Bacteriovoracaceae bacterium]
MVIKSSLFFEHVRSFMRAHRSLPAQSVAVAFSGGVDSRLLLEFATWLKQEGDIVHLRALSVHHHTRAGQDDEMRLVRETCANLAVELKVLHRKGAAPRINLEHQLREARLDLLSENLKSNEELWMGHHLNDSWEWSQLQMARSSEVKPSLGIPLKNGPRWRPFLCVTRRQIEDEAKRRKISWIEDPTNHGPHYARAILRQTIFPLLEKQHPQLLKHYARRSNRLAQQLGVALKTKSKCLVSESSEAILLRGELNEQVVCEAIKKLSQAKRGNLNREILKMLKALKNGKRGPFLFSGKVKAWGYGDWLLITSDTFKTADEYPKNLQMRAWKRSEFKKIIENEIVKKNLRVAPFWCAFDPDQKHRNVLVASGADSLWPKTTGQRMVGVIHAQKLLSRWSDPQQELTLAPLWPLHPESEEG